MSDLLVTVSESCQHALTAIQDVSTRAPVTRTTQALVVGALMGLAAYHLMKKRYRLPPGPRGWPLLGNLLDMTSKEESFYVTLKRWADEKYGPVITIYMGPMRCVILNNVDVVTEALVQKGNDFAGRPFFHSMDKMTEGSKDIAFADYSPAWKLHRKIAMQAMRHLMRGAHLEKVVHHVIDMVTEKMAAESEPFDPNAYCSTLMFHVIDSICFGDTKPYDDPTIQRLIEIFNTSNKEIGNGFLEDIVPLLKHWPTKKFRKLFGLFDQFSDYMNERIEEHKQRFSPDDIRDMTDSILMAQSEAAREESAEVMAMFTDAHVRQTIGDIFGAGVDTSRLTLHWAILFMAGHPEIQKRAQEEIDTATGSRMPGVGDRPQLQYTEAVLYEVMRLSSVLPTAIPHKTLCDTTVGGYDIPKDTMVLINLWAVLHDQNKWDQADEFRPERFLDDQGKLNSKVESWLPFSAGRRVCMGESVARPELLLLLSCLLKRFTISLPEGQPYDPTHEVGGIAVHFAKPYKIVVKPR